MVSEEHDATICYRGKRSSTTTNIGNTGYLSFSRLTQIGEDPHDGANKEILEAMVAVQGSSGYGSSELRDSWANIIDQQATDR